MFARHRLFYFSYFLIFCSLLIVSFFFFKLIALWIGIEHTVGVSEQKLWKENKEVKKTHEEIEDMKKKLVEKDSLIKLQLDRMSKLDYEIIKLKDEGVKTKEENKL